MLSSDCQAIRTCYKSQLFQSVPRSSPSKAIRTFYKIDTFQSVPRSSPSKALRTCYRIDTSQSVVPIGFSFYPPELPPKCRFSHTKIRTGSDESLPSPYTPPRQQKQYGPGNEESFSGPYFCLLSKKTSEETQNSGKQQALVEVNIAGLPKTSGHSYPHPSLH